MTKMNRLMAMSVLRPVALALLLVLATGWARGAPGPLDGNDFYKKGLCVHLGTGDGSLTEKLSRGGAFLVHRLDADAARVGRIRALLGGKAGPDRDVVVLNAAAALAVAGKARGIAEALPLAGKSIDSGAAAAALDKLVAISNA